MEVCSRQRGDGGSGGLMNPSGRCSASTISMEMEVLGWTGRKCLLRRWAGRLAPC